MAQSFAEKGSLSYSAELCGYLCVTLRLTLRNSAIKLCVTLRLTLRNSAIKLCVTLRLTLRNSAVKLPTTPLNSAVNQNPAQKIFRNNYSKPQTIKIQ
jgi:hypothetical protein